MPEYTPLAHVPYPLRSEADDMSAILKGSFRALDSMVVLRAKNTADRDAKFSDVPAGTIVTGTDQDAIWRKNTAGGWSTIWSDTGIVDSGIITPGTSWKIDRQEGCRIGRWAEVWARLIWQGSAAIGNSSGDITDNTACTFQGPWVPQIVQQSSTFFYSGGTDSTGNGLATSGRGSCYISQAGALVLQTIIPATRIGVGGQVSFSCSYTVGE